MVLTLIHLQKVDQLSSLLGSPLVVCTVPVQPIELRPMTIVPRLRHHYRSSCWVWQALDCGYHSVERSYNSCKPICRPKKKDELKIRINSLAPVSVSNRSTRKDQRSVFQQLKFATYVYKSMYCVLVRLGSRAKICLMPFWSSVQIYG